MHTSCTELAQTCTNLIYYHLLTLIQNRVQDKNSKKGVFRPSKRRFYYFFTVNSVQRAQRDKTGRSGRSREDGTKPNGAGMKNINNFLALGGKDAMKNYLNQIRVLEVQIEYKKEQAEMIKLQLGPGSITYEEKSTSPTRTNHTEELLCKLADLEAEIERDVCKLVMLKYQVMEKLDRLTAIYPQGGELLYKRYFKRKTWENIAEDMAYSLPNVYKIHGKALKMLENL